MKITVRMEFEEGGKTKQSFFETEMKGKDSVFSNAQRLNTIVTSMLETGIVDFLGIFFIDKKNEKDSDEKISSDVSGETIDAVSRGQVSGAYNFKGVSG